MIFRARVWSDEAPCFQTPTPNVYLSPPIFTFFSLSSLFPLPIIPNMALTNSDASFQRNNHKQEYNTTDHSQQDISTDVM